MLNPSLPAADVAKTEKPAAPTPKFFKYNVDVEEYGFQNAETTVGFIAEDLNELGLNYFVRYDEAGEPIAIPYEKYVVALQAVVRNLNERITTLENGAN